MRIALRVFKFKLLIQIFSINGWDPIKTKKAGIVGYSPRVEKFKISTSWRSSPKKFYLYFMPNRYSCVFK